MSSTEWAHYFAEKAQPATGSTDQIARANAAYGKCYDARTDVIAAALVRTGKGPSRLARADFAEFEAALKDFTAKALADTQQAEDSQKRSYAALYEKQFRYDFYRAYGPARGAASNGPKREISNSHGRGGAQKDSPAGQSNSSTNQIGASASDSDEMTKAKNRFGELLGALPDDKLHELHAAFGEVVGLHALDDEMRLAVYRYAIFVLEPSTKESSYPPPF